MRLKNLTVKGFKSFANETSLNFNDDVIGVVGPNGSGKSNVVDAIRWVLGEQKSKELRLEKMSFRESQIFSRFTPEIFKTSSLILLFYGGIFGSRTG